MNYESAKNMIKSGESDIVIYRINYYNFKQEYYRAHGIYAVAGANYGFTFKCGDMCIKYPQSMEIINIHRIFPIIDTIDIELTCYQSKVYVYLALMSEQYIDEFIRGSDKFIIDKKIITIAGGKLNWRDVLTPSMYSDDI